MSDAWSSAGEEASVAAFSEGIAKDVASGVALAANHVPNVWPEFCAQYCEKAAVVPWYRSINALISSNVGMPAVLVGISNEPSASMRSRFANLSAGVVVVGGVCAEAVLDHRAVLASTATTKRRVRIMGLPPGCRQT